MRKQIVALCTSLRHFERILPAIIKLSETHDIVMCMLGSGGVYTNPGIGSCDLRLKDFIIEMGRKFGFVIKTNQILKNPEGHVIWYESDIREAIESINLDNVECVIYDDSRTAGHQIAKIIFEPFYQKLRDLDIPVIANIHGNIDDERLWKFASLE